MAPAIDSLVPDSEIAPVSDNNVQAIRAYAQKLFAELATRILAFGIDLFVVLLIGAFIETQLLAFQFGSNRRIVYGFLLFVYFAASWSSPIHATPTQYLFRMHVYHKSGHPLTPAGAMVRSMLVVALWEATMAGFKMAGAANIPIVAAVLCVLVFFVMVTAHRQGIHDLLSRSVVINNRANQSSEQKQTMHEFLAATDSGNLKHRRPLFSA